MASRVASMYGRRHRVEEILLLEVIYSAIAKATTPIARGKVMAATPLGVAAPAVCSAGGGLVLCASALVSLAVVALPVIEVMPLTVSLVAL